MTQPTRDELAEVISRARAPMRWEYRETSHPDDTDYRLADTVAFLDAKTVDVTE